MQRATRHLFNAFVSQIALLNGLEASDMTTKFAVEPSVEQTLEERMREQIEFLQLINMVPVVPQEGETIGVDADGMLAGRTDTRNGERRDPKDPSNLAVVNRYHCRQTNYDSMLRYAKLDAWRHKPNFQELIRNAILKQQGRSRIKVGWYGQEAALTTDPVANPMGQDVNEGWLHKIRTKAPAHVLDDGSLSHFTVDDAGTETGAKAIYVKPGVELYDDSKGNDDTAEADYSSLDALVLDAKRLIPEWHRGDTELVVIVGHELVDEKYFNIAQTTGAKATEVEATDRILRSDKQLGGLPAVRVPFFPADAVLITRLDNLSIYVQEETRRRHIKDEPEYDRVANYESVNEDFVVEEFDITALVENIVVGARPRPAPEAE